MSCVRRLWRVVAPVMALLMAPAAATAAVRLGEYDCAGEHQVVAHCAEACLISYPDRPRPRGVPIEKTEPAASLEARLRGCRFVEGLGYSDEPPPPQRVMGAPQAARTTGAALSPLDMRDMVAGLGRAVSGEAAPLGECLTTLARHPQLAPLAAKVDLAGYAGGAQAKGLLSSRAAPAEVPLLLRWRAERQSCEGGRPGPTTPFDRGEANLAAFTDSGIQLLADGKITYGAFNQAVARKTVEVRRAIAAASPPARTASASAPARGAAAPSGVCGINDYGCHWRQEHPWSPATDQPYAPPPVPGPSPLATAGYGKPQ